MKIVSYRFSSSTCLMLILWLLLLVVRECSCNKNNNKDRRLLGGARIPSLRGLFRQRSSSSSSLNSGRKTERQGALWNKPRKRQDSQAPRQQDEEDEDQLEEQQEEEEVTQVPGNMLPHGIFRGVRDRLFRDSNDNDDDHHNNNSQLIPLVYRYYGRNRARTHMAGGSIPFLILGPNVDHWKIISQQLAAKGFSVMACERVKEDDSTPTLLQCTLLPSSTNTAPHQLSRATQTLLTLLDALRWKRVVLVACDSESALAVRAALELAPERIVGLVLCGSLEPVEPLIKEYSSNRGNIMSTNGSSGAMYFLGSTPPSPLPHGMATAARNTFHVDRFLKHNLKCPFTIVWGGDDSPMMDDDDDDDDNTLLPPSLPVPSNSDYCGINNDAVVAATRRTILGAGSAPHRRRPEMFAWVLTRFVEEEIATTGPLLPLPPIVQQQQQQQPAAVQQQRTILATSSPSASIVTIVPASARQQPVGLQLPFGLQEFFSSQALVVFGRVMATALFYATAIRVGYYQYDHFWQGSRQVSAQLYKCISTPSKWGCKIVGALHIGEILSIVRDKGVVPILSCLKRVTCGVLFFLPFHKNDSHVKEDNVILELTDDSEAERQTVPETEPPPPNKKDEEQADSKKDDDNDKDSDSGTKKRGSNDLEEEEETKPRFKPFFLLDRVIA